MKRSFRRPHLLWQTAFAVAALSTAVSLPVVLLSVGGGVYQHEIASLQNAGYEIAVTGPGLHGIVGAHGLSGRIDAIPGVAAASPVLTAPVDAFQGTVGPLPALAEGIVPSAFAATEGPEERAILPASLPLGDPTDSAHFGNGSYDGPASGDVLVSAPFAAELGTSVGGTVWLGASADRT
ncbi:MAG TPA: hypothetical protein VLY85_02275, partial [Thermoplasmata archaeon]|nr:hypothetical protein [Thermoplasmata archaeon]